MARWNQDALIALQGELKLNVITSTGLTDRLQRAAGGFMDRAEAQAVESKPSNEQMGEVIRILLGKRNADFKIFCRILRDSNYSAWAAQLEKKAREFRGEPGKTICAFSICVCSMHVLIHFTQLRTYVSLGFIVSSHEMFLLDLFP